MESNTHCSDIKYFYLEILAFYFILLGLSGDSSGIKEHQNMSSTKKLQIKKPLNCPTNT